MNPLLPRRFFVPDAEARVMPDGRLYLYGSLDIPDSGRYCSREYRVFSTGDPKLERWTDHGVVFRNSGEAPGVSWNPGVSLYAPDAVGRNGKTYLFLCGANSFEGVAEADDPAGPFGPAVPVSGADGDSIDPSVLIDDDGQAYLFWGQFELRGARLAPDLRGIVPETLRTRVLTEQEHGFHEGSSIRKRNGVYYMLYTDISRGKATCLSYATAKSPLGPYKKGGVVIDNTACDGETWNNHGSIAEFGGRWFVFYHRSSRNSRYNRRVCAEPIEFLPDGSIPEVRMTSQGVSGPLPARETTDASVACRMMGDVRISPKPGTGGGEEILVCRCGGHWGPGWAEYRYLDFGAGVSSVKIVASGEGAVQLRAENGVTVGRVPVRCGGFSVFRGAVRGLAGVKPLWLLFEGTGISVDTFQFE